MRLTASWLSFLLLSSSARVYGDPDLVTHAALIVDGRVAACCSDPIDRGAPA